MRDDRVKQLIKQTLLIDNLRLEDIAVEDIGDELPLYDGGLNLDSIEVLQLIAGTEELFGVDTQAMSVEMLREQFRTVNAIAQFVLTHQPTSAEQAHGEHVG
jgi:acyl carrier protein